MTIANALNLNFSKSLVNFSSTTLGTLVEAKGHIPQDNTIPQNTEGTQVMTMSYTPLSASNTLEIDVVLQVGAFDASSPSGAAVTGALFQDSIADAIAVGATNTHIPVSESVMAPIVIKKVMVAGTTSSITFNVRIGSPSFESYLNGIVGIQLYGGESSSNITIKEYA